MTSPELITDAKKFSDIFEKSKGIENPFPSLILRNTDEVLISEYTDYECAEFFPFLQTLLSVTGETACYFLALEPDPISYFFAHFKKYPAFEITTETKKDEYFALLHLEFDKNFADALVHTSDIHVIFPLSLSWYIYGDRDRDLLVLRMLSSKYKYELPEIKRTYPFEGFTWEEAMDHIKENMGE
jgi:hypothetical protein